MKVYEFECIDAHTCGNPVRLVKTGVPDLQGANMSEKRQHFLQSYDWIRKGLMFEPRGHDMMSGSMLYPSHDQQNDAAVLFLETSGCLPMCGHGTIGTVTIALEHGLIQPKQVGEVRLETPAGLIRAEYEMQDGKVNWVRIRNVGSYLAAEGIQLDHPVLGKLRVDVAYGGNFYAIVDPQDNFPGMEHYKAAELVALSQELRQLVNLEAPEMFIHPEDATIRGVSHVMWTGKPLDPLASGRNAVFYGDKAIDRSPCGTGTSARMAQLFAKGRLGVGEEYLHESIIGSKFLGKIEAETRVGPKRAILPSIRGWARVYGYNRILIDEADPYAHGFQVI